MDPLKIQGQNPFSQPSTAVNQQQSQWAAQQQGVQPVFGGLSAKSSQGIPKAAHDKFAQNGINAFDVSRFNISQPETRTEDQGQKLYMMA